LPAASDLGAVGDRAEHRRRRRKASLQFSPTLQPPRRGGTRLARRRMLPTEL